MIRMEKKIQTIAIRCIVFLVVHMLVSWYSNSWSLESALLFPPIQVGTSYKAIKMEVIITTMTSATLGFGIFYMIAGTTFLGLFSMPEYEYTNIHLVYGLLMGALAAVLGAICLFILGFCKATFGRLLRRGGPLGGVLAPVVGGLALGIIFKFFPLTVMSGSNQLRDVIDIAEDSCSTDASGVETCNTEHVGYLLASAFMKILALGISMWSGFVGGIMFPLFYYGGSIGLAIHVWFPAIPQGLAFGCLFASVAGCIFAAPFSLIMLVSLTMTTSPYNQVKSSTSFSTFYLSFSVLFLLLVHLLVRLLFLLPLLTLLHRRLAITFVSCPIFFICMWILRVEKRKGAYLSRCFISA